MKLTSQEIVVIINSLEARKEWAEEEGEVLDEQPHLISALNKLKGITTLFEKKLPLGEKNGK